MICMRILISSFTNHTHIITHTHTHTHLKIWCLIAKPISCHADCAARAAATSASICGGVEHAIFSIKSPDEGFTSKMKPPSTMTPCPILHNTNILYVYRLDIYVYVYMYTYIYIYIYVCVCVPIYIYICLYLCTYVLYIYIYTICRYIYIYIHTYIFSMQSFRSSWPTRDSHPK